MKTILVGNGTEILDDEYGELIDSFDRVIRINRFIVSDLTVHTGTKTDVWVVSQHWLNEDFEWEHPHERPETIICCPYAGHNEYDNINPERKPNTSKVPKSVAYEISNEYDPTYKTWPSTGVVAMWHFQPCHIIGFDGFSVYKNGHFEYFKHPKTYFYDYQKVGHNSENEVNFVKRMVDERRVTKLDINDFNK
jgi:hypothetical protein